MSTLETESDSFEGPPFSGLMVTVTQSAPVMLPLRQQLCCSTKLFIEPLSMTS